MCVIERKAIKFPKPLVEMLKKIAYFSYNSKIASTRMKPVFCLSRIFINTEKSVLTSPFPDPIFFRNKRPVPCHGKETSSPNLLMHQTYF